MKKLLYLISLVAFSSLIGMEGIQDILTDRATISLLEAIMKGTARAVNGDFDIVDFDKEQVFRIPIKAALREMYRSLQLGSPKTEDQTFRMYDSPYSLIVSSLLAQKLIKDPSAPVTDQELISRQRVRFAGFICGFDLDYERKRHIEAIKEKGSWKYEKKIVLRKLDASIEAVRIHRELYKAALASCDEAAINHARVRRLRIMPFTTLENDLNVVRRKCHDIHEDPYSCAHQ